jgi:hypothetical protein
MDWYHSQGLGGVAPGDRIGGWHILPSVIQPDLTDPTLMATRIVASGRTAATTLFGGFAGVGLIRWNYINDALPDPLPNVFSPDGDMDWIARVVTAVPSGTLAGSILQFSFLDKQYESKARRRLGNDSSLLIVFANEVDQSDINFASDIRTLIKE